MLKRLFGVLFTDPALTMGVFINACGFTFHCGSVKLFNYGDKSEGA